MKFTYLCCGLNPTYIPQRESSQLAQELPHGVFFYASFRDGGSMTPERMVACTELIKRHLGKTEPTDEADNILLRNLVCNK